MARVTVEDCILQVSNRFKLVMLASQRARDLGTGAALTVSRDRDKNPVVALREIADTTVNQDVLEESLIRGMQKHSQLKGQDEELLGLLEEELVAVDMGAPDVDEEINEDVLTVKEGIYSDDIVEEDLSIEE